MANADNTRTLIQITRIKALWERLQSKERVYPRSTEAIMRLNLLFFVLGGVGRNKSLAKKGTKITATKKDPARARIRVSAISLNIMPMMPLSIEMGMKTTIVVSVEAKIGAPTSSLALSMLCVTERSPVL